MMNKTEWEKGEQDLTRQGLRMKKSEKKKKKGKDRRKRKKR